MARFALNLGLAAALAGCAWTGAAFAQSIYSNSAEFNAGYGRTPGQENRPVDFSTRDANGNRVIIDGMILTGEDQSVFARAWAGGAVDTVSGVGSGAGGSTAIGNNLLVITQGSNNVVIVDSTQINNGTVTAGTSLTGGVSNNGQ
jgi:holdfast attachment protein HfaA